jgi:hypothetical protein
MIPFDNKGYVIELDAWEDQYGTDIIEWYAEHHGYFPYWLKHVKDTRAVQQYVAVRKGDWIEATNEGV